MDLVTTTELLSDPIAHYPAATVACFDPTSGSMPRRQLDEDRNVRFLERLAESGVPAVLIAASTGHGHARTVEELQPWFRSSAEADLGATVKMALLRPEDGEAANQRLVALLKDLDYRVVFVRPGTDLPSDATATQIASNMRWIVAEAARRELAVGIYSIPDVSGLPMTVEAAAQLLDGPGGDNIVAIKVTEADYMTSTRRFLEDSRFQRAKVVQGWDPHLAQALQDGPRFDPQGRQRCGVTSGPMSFAVFQYIHILDAAMRDQWDEVEKSQQAVTTLFASMQDDPQKFADLQRAKFVMGLGHPITADVDGHDVQRVLDALADLTRSDDRSRLARSLDLMGDGPYHQQLQALY